MIRVALIDQDGKVQLPEDVATAAELLAAAEQARTLIRECERQAQRKRNTDPTAEARRVPYS